MTQDDVLLGYGFSGVLTAVEDSWNVSEHELELFAVADYSGLGLLLDQDPLENRCRAGCRAAPRSIASTRARGYLARLLDVPELEPATT